MCNFKLGVCAESTSGVEKKKKSGESSGRGVHVVVLFGPAAAHTQTETLKMAELDGMPELLRL